MVKDQINKKCPLVDMYTLQGRIQGGRQFPPPSLQILIGKSPPPHFQKEN